MDELSSLILAEIRKSGPIGFDRFMELALYHPELGYYRRPTSSPRTGREGDFITSVNVGPLFGRLLARQFFQMWEQLGKPAPFWIIEQGSEDGQFACDVLTWIRSHAAQFFATLRYASIEPSPRARRVQEKRIESENLLESVTWYSDLEQLNGEEATGVFFSNELVDALPVRSIMCRDGIWWERCVTEGENETFLWTLNPISSPELLGAIQNLGLPPMESYTTEVHLLSEAWMQQVGRALARGYVITIDYGFLEELYYGPFRKEGTLTSYLEHRRISDVLASPGRQDITAHVNFSRLTAAGESSGLTSLGLLNQERFLMGVAHDELSGIEELSCGIATSPRAWQTLTNPSHFGNRFQVLVQSKNAPGNLSGLRYGAAK